MSAKEAALRQMESRLITSDQKFYLITFLPLMM